MPLTIDDFRYPESHPYGMLSGVVGRDTSEKEQALAVILQKIIEESEFGDVYIPIYLGLNSRYYQMVQDGLLVEYSHGYYKLTPKSAGLLYTIYAQVG